MARKKWYVVIVGREVGVFDNWLEVTPLVYGVSCSQHASFRDEEEARRAFEEAKAKGHVKQIGSSLGSFSSSSSSRQIGTPTKHSTKADVTHEVKGSQAPHRTNGVQRSPSPEPSTPAQTKKAVRLYSAHAELSSPESYITYGIESLRSASPSSPNITMRKHQRTPSSASSSLRYTASTVSTSSRPTTPSSKHSRGASKSSTKPSPIRRVVVGELSDADSYPTDTDESSGPEDVTPPNRSSADSDELPFTLTGKLTIGGTRSRIPCSPCKLAHSAKSNQGTTRVCMRCGQGFHSISVSGQFGPALSKSRSENSTFDGLGFFSQPVHVPSSPKYDAAHDPRSPMQRGTRIPGLTSPASSPFSGRPSASSKNEPISLRI
ncbi:hypothetical protein VKT23_004053 [Stygiomarasmius scandens]|uniref:Ribonuclease H1 N-terminal domain-containing protein n=1 Tax=Marasmiellus scandens TaxID=2682957 RepID=A0ABR1JTL4_9AGAR